MEIEAAVVELYGLLPEQFVAARNRMVKAARADGDERLAAAVAGLRKPTVAAWLANQLVRTDPDGVHALTELGEELRDNYLSTDSAHRRKLTRRRHDLISGLVKTARTKAAPGRRITAQTADRLMETLDAALIDPGAAQLLRSGQLTSALRHVGFGVVDESGDLAHLPPARPRVVGGKPTGGKANGARANGARANRSRSNGAAADGSHANGSRANGSRSNGSRAAGALAERRTAQERRIQQAEAEYAAAEAARAEAERILDAHQHRIADLEADIERMTEQLDEARRTLREARRQATHLQHTLNETTYTARSLDKHRSQERQRLESM
ncbi:hypothetical protein AB0E69_26035 [Kribbella sp. NPDC026611]|uniref:hypothetical protein n=1 Tax=Kribbella sp. NPDC026611 TaxID=3154911 RepID=UPI0034073C23